MTIDGGASSATATADGLSKEAIGKVSIDSAITAEQCAGVNAAAVDDSDIAGIAAGTTVATNTGTNVDGGTTRRPRQLGVNYAAT